MKKLKLNLDWCYWASKGYEILFSEQEKADYIRQQVGDYRGRSEIKVFALPWLGGKCFAVRIGELPESKKRFRIIGTAEDFHGYEHQFSGGYDPATEDGEDAAERLKPRNTWVTSWRVVEEG